MKARLARKLTHTPIDKISPTLGEIRLGQEHLQNRQAHRRGVKDGEKDGEKDEGHGTDR